MSPGAASGVSVEGLTKFFDAKPPTTAIDDMQLHVAEGEFLVLLGPSGCGKTTTLRCLAGLETPDKGRIAFGPDVVFDATRHINLAPDKRNTGMVFQSYALWPHLTVRKNIAYPLRARRLRAGLAEGWAESTAEMVDCGSLLDRLPAQLSGGQQQRVALARGLVARPDLVLFDEPLSNLDARLRDEVRGELHELHGRLGFTAVFVTHDQSEAFALGDRVAIMRRGRIEQYGAPEDVFEQPTSEYVADFIGMANRMVCDYSQGAWFVCGLRTRGAALHAVPDGATTMRLRPDDLDLAPRDAVVPAHSVVIDVTVIDSEYGGRHMDVIVDANGTRLHARVSAGERDSWARGLRSGAPVAAAFDPAAGRFFSPDDAQASAT